MVVSSYKQAELTIDHPDFLIKRHGEKELVQNVAASGIPVLIPSLVASWERAMA